MESVRQLETVVSFPEKVFVFFVLLLSSGAFMSLTVNPGAIQEEASGQAGMQTLWVLVYLIVVALLWRKYKSSLRDLLQEYLLVALVLLALGSALWSESPGVSLRRSVALVLTCLFGVYFGSRFTLREQLRVLACVGGVCVVFSFLFGVLGLGNPVVDLPGSWYGIFVHKNVLGRMMVLSILVFMVLARTELMRRGLLWTGCGLAFLLLLLSKSTTSLVVLVVLLAILPFARALGRDKSRGIKIATLGLVLSAAGFYWVSNHVQDILRLFGKDITLTGRLQLWILSVVMAIRRPWLGYGYNAFWLGPGSSSARILAAVQWDAPHAHNGLLEIWLELGLVGVMLFLAGFVSYLVRAIVLLREDHAPEAIWPLCFLAFMFLSNLTESDFLARNTIFFILYVGAVMSMRRGKHAAKNTVEGRPVRPAHQLLPAPKTCEG